MIARTNEAVDATTAKIADQLVTSSLLPATHTKILSIVRPRGLSTISFSVYLCHPTIDRTAVASVARMSAATPGVQANHVLLRSNACEPMNAPWEVKPPSDDGDREIDVLYAAVGRALSRWEELEEDLADLFSGLVGSTAGVHDFSNPACRAYGSIPNFNTRADMLSAAAAAFFENVDRPHLESSYNELIKLCRRFAARRNDIAHGTTWMTDVGNFLVPPYYNIRKYAGDNNPAYRYSSKEIYYYEKMFADLISRVRQLERQICDVNNEQSNRPENPV